MSLPHNESDLSRIYAQRFAANLDYRKRVWRVLIDSFFQRYVPRDATVLDLGCGYGEFINQVHAGRKYAMDLNPDAPRYLSPDVQFLRQDCFGEALENRGFCIKRQDAAFLPYTMAGKAQVPTLFLRIYLAAPWIWPFLGRQFFVLAERA